MSGNKCGNAADSKKEGGADEERQRIMSRYAKKQTLNKS